MGGGRGMDGKGRDGREGVGDGKGRGWEGVGEWMGRVGDGRGRGWEGEG